MSAIKKSITLPKTLDSFVLRKARAKARARGATDINYSEALADLIIEARQKEQELKKAA